MALRRKTSDIPTVRHGVSLLTEYDIHLFREGNHFRLYEKLGAHCLRVGGEEGVLFAVWAPNAESVSVIGDFNGWRPGLHPLAVRWDGSGIWEGFVPGLGPGCAYKYHVRSRHGGYAADKGDPFARAWEVPPRTASIVTRLDYGWGDGGWMARRGEANRHEAPWAIYEMHLGSWRRSEGKTGRPLGYRELAPRLVEYLLQTGFTHVEFLPVMEHPFYGSWGYQSVGYFAPTARYGPPEDFMFLVDSLHRAGIGVVLDWVPSHFPADLHGLAYFDGTHLYEHADPRKGFHPEWKSCVFNHGRNEVRNFLISSALFWLDRYHADALRVDAVASMLYLDYARGEGEWIPNVHGGNENLEAIAFLKDLNRAVYREYPDVQTIAEESTAWPMVSKPVYLGGLGFGMKWNMGWMHDTLEYFRQDPLFRKYHHDRITFSIWYAFTENFVLPLSHDEVVHGKGSLYGKMAGTDEWQRYANLRLLLGYLYGHPGKKLLFMGGEIAQWKEWAHDEALEWEVLGDVFHSGVQRWIRDLNRLYRDEPSLHEQDFAPEGFRWVDGRDWENSVLAFLRRAKDGSSILVALNMTPVPRHDYRLGVPTPGYWRELANSDATEYGGSGQGNLGGTAAEAVPSHGLAHSLRLTLPPLAAVFLKGP